jgi:hypothetical protein
MYDDFALTCGADMELQIILSLIYGVWSMSEQRFTVKKDQITTLILPCK